jgi:lipopolysaccharide transport system permease protein
MSPVTGCRFLEMMMTIAMSNTPLADHPSPTDTVVIKPRTGWVPIDMLELWRYRELLWFLAVRDVKVRYKQSLLGVGWAVIQPLLTTLVFAVVLENLMGGGGGKVTEATTAGGNNLPTAGLPDYVPYFVSTYCAMTLWQLFGGSVSRGGNSLINNQHLITKVYFPRLLMPMAPIIASVLDFVIAFVLLIGFMAWKGVWPDWHVVLAPLFILLTVGSALAFSLWLAALNAIFRDVQYIIPFAVQIGMYVSPVLYTTRSVFAGKPEWMKVVYAINPMVGAVEGFRWSLLGGQAPELSMWLPSTIVTAFALVGGLFFFRRLERIFADVV